MEVILYNLYTKPNFNLIYVENYLHIILSMPLMYQEIFITCLIVYEFANTLTRFSTKISKNFKNTSQILWLKCHPLSFGRIYFWTISSYLIFKVHRKKTFKVSFAYSFTVRQIYSALYGLYHMFKLSCPVKANILTSLPVSR